MGWEESSTRSAPEGACQSQVRGLDVPDVYKYLIVRMPWLKSMGRRCSCSKVNCSDSFKVRGQSDLMYFSLPPMTATLPNWPGTPLSEALRL